MVIFQANSNLHAAKAHLEMMYENLSNELYHFDYQKELELRDIFIEYTTLKFDYYEKVMQLFQFSLIFLAVRALSFRELYGLLCWLRRRDVCGISLLAEKNRPNRLIFSLQRKINEHKYFT